MEPEKIRYDDGRKSSSKFKASYRWWEQPEEETHDHVWALFQRLEKDQSYRNQENLKHARLYSNRVLRGLLPGNFAQGDSAKNLPQNRLTLNVCKSVVDTAAAKIAKNRPRALFLTEKGNYQQGKRAKLLTQFVSGQFEQAKVYKQGPKVFRDGAIFGTGAMKVFVNGEGQVRAERAIIDEIYVDDVEAVYGEPTNLYQRKYVHKDVLCANYDEHEAAIRACTVSASAPGGANVNAEDMLLVVEAWHLPAPGEKDGRHVVVIDGKTLFSEEWKHEWFPFAFYRWSERLLGFYGEGIIEQIVSVQVEVNQILRDISESQRLFARPQVWMQGGSEAGAKITNKIGAVNTYVGNTPVFMTPAAMSADVYQHLDRLEGKAYQISGVSQLSATSKKPSGLDSGAALREYNDIETERFVLAGQGYEEFYLDIAKIMIALHKDQAENGDKEQVVMASSNKFLRKIKWSEVNLEDDAYVMKAYPASLLPTQPAGRMEKVQEMTKAGYIGKEEAMSLLDFPDVERYVGVATAALDDADYIIDIILEDGKYVEPEQYMNLAVLLQRAQSAYLRARQEQVPEERVELLRTLIDETVRMLGVMNAPPAAAPPAAGAPLPPPAALPPPPLPVQPEPMVA